MKIRSPPNLHYPISVVELLAAPGDEVKRSAPLFSYTYESTVQQADRYGEVKDVKKRFPARFDSSADGVISQWYIKKGSVIERSSFNLIEIEEPCTHEIQFGSLCTNCGKDMTEVDYLTDERNIDRATVNMTHDNIALLVSHKEATRADEEAKHRLLEARKLALIVDLDQTIIHTTCERTIAEWQADPDNPNYEAVKDVRSFQLADDNVAQVAANWYYVKMRPGLADFLERMSQKYEMHIYTMATRTYAQAIAKIIDPDRRYFGDRILSRDENYQDKTKNLQRLFPTNTDMVVIIDDRADVWSYSENLVRVPVYNFFPGAGDINASFLPKQHELIGAAAKKELPMVPVPKEETANESEPKKAYSVAGKPAENTPSETDTGTLTELEQQLISLSKNDDPEVLEQQVKEQEKVIVAQQTERPLLQQQLMLDKEDQEAEQNENPDEIQNGDAQSNEHHKQRHSILHDDDAGLEIIEKHLVAIHQRFYDEYRRKRAPVPDVRVAALRSDKSPKKRMAEVMPDIKILMPSIKEEVLAGTVVVFSGIMPLGHDVLNSDFARWIMSFGAEVSLNVSKQTTHVIANPDRKTMKVKKAAHYPSIKIVNADWMFQCCTRWEHVDETPYLIEIDQTDRGASPWDELEESDPGVTGDEDGEAAEEDISKIDMSPDKWKDLDDEFNEFMNESDDSETNSASDSESVRSDASAQITDSKPSIKKRKRTTGSVDGSEADESDVSVTSTSKLQRRKKRTMERVTSLANVVTAEKSSGLPSPETTGPEEGHGDEEKDADPAGLAADDSDPEEDDGLEAEMMAEFGKSDDEDAA